MGILCHVEVPKGINVLQWLQPNGSRASKPGYLYSESDTLLMPLSMQCSTENFRDVKIKKIQLKTFAFFFIFAQNTHCG